MDVPVDVLIHNTVLGMKAEEGTLLWVGSGFYEVNCRFGGAVHRVLLPVQGTVLIAKDPQERFATDFEIER